MAFSALATAAALTAFVPTSGTAYAATPDGDVSVDVVGGHVATEPYPAMASLQIATPDNPHQHICGATLVSRQWAVTNAHCVTAPSGAVMPPQMIHLRIGSHDRTTAGEYVGVTAVLPHAEWDWATGTNRVADIAMIRLDRYVQLQQIEIATRLQRGRAVARVLGFGTTEPAGDGDLPTMLQELDTRLVPDGRCTAGGISEGEICVNNVHGTDGICYGDSGGPVMQRTQGRWQLIGGASRGTTDDGCGTGPAIFTDTTYYRTWMFDVMRTGKVPPAAPGAAPAPPSTATAATRSWHGLAA
ncbi:serine protease [Virgisporangium aliadipatigenens]|uniref:Serine protease n=2 Tax=Virgisporangium aliadipatigenens TaxID=741659 RepID=A0A8J3YTV9_9ACTN|nr:serine protease [Virgisporangium aliadipatigenens]